MKLKPLKMTIEELYFLDEEQVYELVRTRWSLEDFTDWATTVRQREFDIGCGYRRTKEPQ